MTQPARILITDRKPSGVDGHTAVTAQVDDGDSGEYLIANWLVNSEAEILEIREQATKRAAIRSATAAGES